ncbi:MAG: acyl-CoA dehydrogenase C-terminal domain-containing protein, partial [Betaproteobacteria bacterium]
LFRIDGDARRLAEAPDAVLAQIGSALAASARALQEATDWLLAHDAQPAQCAAGAVPFLRLAGTVIGGWLSARMAEAATAQLTAGAGDAGFLGAKRATASHYAAHVLVQAPMLRDIVMHGADSTLALADDQL